MRAAGYTDRGSETQRKQDAPVLDLRWSQERRGRHCPWPVAGMRAEAHRAAREPGGSVDTAVREPAGQPHGCPSAGTEPGEDRHLPPRGPGMNRQHGRACQRKTPGHTKMGLSTPLGCLLPPTSFPRKERLDPKTRVIASEQRDWSSCLTLNHR